MPWFDPFAPFKTFARLLLVQWPCLFFLRTFLNYPSTVSTLMSHVEPRSARSKSLLFRFSARRRLRVIAQADPLMDSGPPHFPPAPYRAHP
jgi:hypothetical protein